MLIEGNYWCTHSHNVNDYFSLIFFLSWFILFDDYMHLNSYNEMHAS